MSNIGYDVLDLSIAGLSLTGKIESSLCEDFKIHREPGKEDSCPSFSSVTISVAYSPAEAATSILSNPEDEKVNSSFERSFSCPSIPDDSNEQKLAENEHDDEEKPQTYRMHLATVPGDMANKFKLKKALPIHQNLINIIKQFLECLNIAYQVLDDTSFSCTDKWGVEPYGCFLVTCTRTMISGLGALFGMAFRQDAVGVFTCHTDDKDQPHNIFLVTRLDGSPITVGEALKIVKPVCTSFKMLSAQRDETGASMEFHDYCNKTQPGTSTNLFQLLSNSSRGHTCYRVLEGDAKSFLVNKEDYHQAIEKAGLTSFELIIQMCRVHSKAYPTC